MAAVTDGFGELAKTFVWLFFALVGMVEWPDPELGLLVNALIDVANPPS